MAALSWLRVPVAFGLALMISATMFWFLARLIQSPTDINEMAKAARIEFTRMRKDTEVEKKREEVRKAERQRAAQVPVAPRMSVANNTSISAAPVQMVQPKIDASGVKMNLTAGGSDRGVAPLVRVNPEYPRRALERGIEGWVHVRFTVTAAGTVKDLVVVDSEPKGVFDEAASKAVLRWRYNPRVENGVAVERVGEQTLIRFKLEN
jgi:protein TonB